MYDFEIDNSLLTQRKVIHEQFLFFDENVFYDLCVEDSYIILSTAIDDNEMRTQCMQI